MLSKVSAVLISGLLMLVLLSSSGKASASCEMDNDWPKAPCYDSPPWPTLAKKISEFSGYHDYKGKEWMDLKKAEMTEAIQNNQLKKWIDNGYVETEFGKSNPNKNVWYYYYLNGQAPFYIEKEKSYHHPSPLQQIKSGVLPSNVFCNAGLELIIKSHDNASVCIKPSSFPNLVKIGFTNPSEISSDKTKIVHIACQIPSLTIGDLTKKSKYIVIGTVFGGSTTKPIMDKSRNQTVVYTDFYITVEKDLSNQLKSGSYVTVRVLGGNSENFMAISNCDIPFKITNKMLLFIVDKQTGSENYDIAGMKAGEYVLIDGKAFGLQYPDGINEDEFVSQIEKARK